MVILCELDHPHDNEHCNINEMLLDEHHSDLFAYSWPVESSECERDTVQSNQNVNRQGHCQDEVTLTLDCDALEWCIRFIVVETCVATVGVLGGLDDDCVKDEEQGQRYTADVIKFYTAASWGEGTPNGEYQVGAQAYVEDEG